EAKAGGPDVRSQGCARARHRGPVQGAWRWLARACDRGSPAMNRARPVIIVVALLIGAGLLAWFFLGGGKRERTLSGYIEGENLYLAAPVAGTVETVSAVEGQRVSAGQRLFQIEPATLTAQGAQAQANVAAARTQIASAEAQAQQAEADVSAASADAVRARQD